MIGTDGEKELKEYALSACLDDDDMKDISK